MYGKKVSWDKRNQIQLKRWKEILRKKKVKETFLKKKWKKDKYGSKMKDLSGKYKKMRKLQKTM